MFSRCVGVFVGMALVAGQPAAAQDMDSTGSLRNARPAAFGGLTVRLPLGRQSTAKPEARLQLTTYQMDTSQPWRTRTFNRKGLELGVSKEGKPMLLAGGQNVAQAEQKMGLSTGTTLLIVGGVLLVVVLVAAAAASAQSDLLNPCSGSELDCD